MSPITEAERWHLVRRGMLLCCFEDFAIRCSDMWTAQQRVEAAATELAGVDRRRRAHRSAREEVKRTLALQSAARALGLAVAALRRPLELAQLCAYEPEDIAAVRNARAEVNDLEDEAARLAPVIEAAAPGWGPETNRLATQAREAEWWLRAIDGAAKLRRYAAENRPPEELEFA